MLLLVLGANAGAAEVMPYQACATLPREGLLSCFSDVVDTNKDGTLSGSEISAFLLANDIPGEPVLMRLCDLNKDGSLSMSDWTLPGACAQTQPIITRACYICVKAGWTPTVTKR